MIMDIGSIRGLLTAGSPDSVYRPSGRGAGAGNASEILTRRHSCRWATTACRPPKNERRSNDHEQRVELVSSSSAPLVTARLFLARFLATDNARQTKKSPNPNRTSGTRTFANSTTRCRCGGFGCSSCTVIWAAGYLICYPGLGQFRRRRRLEPGTTVRG